MAHGTTAPTDPQTTDRNRDRDRDHPRPQRLPDDATVEQTDAGGLVYDVTTDYDPLLDREYERERVLVGFVNVRSWQAMRAELRKRGHDTGASRHLPVFTAENA